MKKILLYNLENSKGQKIKQLCALHKIKFKSVPTSSYLETLGFLAQVGKEESCNLTFDGTPFEDEMMVFINFNDTALEAFLKEYNHKKIEKVNLKAGLTPYNISWNSLQLRDELQREHDEFNKNPD